MKKTALLLMFLSIVVKVIGLGREIALSYFYGTSSTSDAYLIALIIPTVIFDFLGAAIATGYIPMYNTIEKQQGIKKANQYTNNLINILLIFSLIIVILTVTFAEQIVSIFAPGFERDTFLLAVSFTKVSLFGIFFTVLVYLMRSFLQIKGNYAIPALVSLPMNIVIIFSIYLSDSLEKTLILSLGLLFAMIAQFLFLIPFVIKKGYKYKFIMDFKDPYIKKMFYLSLPILIGVAVNDINKIVDKSLASKITSGGISALNYAITLNSVVQGIFVLSISAAMYPLISKMSVEGNIIGLKKTVSEAINIIILLVIPVTIGIIIFSEQIITILFARGAFDANSIKMTSDALFFYSIGMLGFGLREIFARPFYAVQDTLTPMINASIGVIINIILNYLLSKYLGIGGLALATSISGFVTSGLLFISLRKKFGSLGTRSLLITSLKVLFASSLMGGLAKLSFNYFENIMNANLSLIISIILGVFFYFIIIFYMKISDANIIVNALKRKVKR